MDTKFAVAIHVLLLMAESPVPMHSEHMAGSVGTHASYVRKILLMLKRAGLVDSHRGVGGYSLQVAPEQISLLRIHQAVAADHPLQLWDIHTNPGMLCIVGRYIRPLLADVFEEMEDALAHALAEKTLADCVADLHRRQQQP